jgi:serine/threonine protein kinase
MTPERWRQVEELYHAAAECDPEARAALLAHADPDLRREIESLFAQKSGEGVLDPLAVDLPVELTATMPAPGSQLGPYKIEALVGAGGMGQVYRARDTRLGRDVAVKLSAREFGHRSTSA